MHMIHGRDMRLNATLVITNCTKLHHMIALLGIHNTEIPYS